MEDENSPFDRHQMTHFLSVGQRAARARTRDRHLIEEAAHQGVMALIEYVDSVDPDKHDAYVGRVAANHAKRHGERLGREEAFGRGGSEPPKRHDEQADAAVVKLIEAMSDPAGPSLPSLQAIQDAFRQRWMLLDEPTRSLLIAKYVHGHPTKKIAAELGLAPGSVDNRLTKAKAAARAVLAELADGA